MDRVVTLIASALLVAGCAKAPEVPATASTGAAEPGQPFDIRKLDADVATLLKALDVDPERVMREMSQSEYLLQGRLMSVSGMEELLGGPQAADAALRAFMGKTLRVWTSDLEARARRMTNSSPVDGAGAIIGGYVELAAFFREVNDFYGNGADKTVTSKTDHANGTTSVSNGNVALESTTTVNEGSLSGNFATRMKMNVCPDAHGQVILEIQQETRMSSGGRGSNVNAHARIVRTVTDDAVYGSYEGDIRVEAAVFGPQAGSFVDVSLRRSTLPNGVNGLELNRRSSQATVADADGIARLTEALEVFALSFTVLAQEVWQSGACVKLEPTTDPAKRSDVDPSTSFSVRAEPRSRIDGSPTGGTVRAVLTGESSVNPANTKVPADASFTYIAPGEKDKDASIAFEARSKRGIGKAVVPFDTRTGKAYSVEGGADEFHGTGLACGLDSQFVVQGSGVTVTFVPSSSQGGKYSYTGSMGGFAVWGNGSYTVNYQGDVAVSLHATGPGSVKTPRGTFTRSGSETYTLTPHEGDCGG